MHMQVFLSSTFSDLKRARSSYAALQAYGDPGSQDLKRDIRTAIETADVFIAIIHHRYGSPSAWTLDSVAERLRSLGNQISTTLQAQQSNAVGSWKVTRNTKSPHASIQFHTTEVTGYWTPQGVRTYDQVSELRLFSVHQSSDWTSSYEDYFAKRQLGWFLDDQFQNYSSNFLITAKASSVDADHDGLTRFYGGYFPGPRTLANPASSNLRDKFKVLSEQMDKSIKELVQSLKKQLSRFYHAILVALSRKLKIKQGIGKGTEGYIPFRTWARGSLRAQLVNQLFFIDRLSQLNTV